MRDFLREMVGLCRVRMVMDGLLPENDSAKYADLGVGLCIMLCMLRAFLSFLREAA